MDKRFFLFLFIFLFLFSFVNANILKQGTDVNLTISCENINCSDGDINLTLINSDLERVVDNQVTTIMNGYLFYTLNLTQGNYQSFFASDNDFYDYSFDVTEDGLEITEGRSILIIGLLSILVLLLFISLFALFKIENYIGKFTIYWISHILIVLICFVGWQIGVEGLLGGMALTGIFRIMFWIFTVAIVPMIFLSMAWIFYIHTYNEHFQKLVEKGEDTATAFTMTNKKYRRKPSW